MFQCLRFGGARVDGVVKPYDLKLFANCPDSRACSTKPERPSTQNGEPWAANS